MGEDGSAGTRPRPESLGILTFVTGEMEVLELLEASGVCKDDRSEAQARQQSPRGAGRMVRSPPPAACHPWASHFSQAASSEASGQSGVPSHSRKLSMQQPSLQRNSVG